MMPTCIRCQRKATTMLTYHHGDATAFLHSVSGHETIHDGLLLCDDHARRFSAPRGWMTVDRRRAMDTDPLGQVGQ